MTALLSTWFGNIYIVGLNQFYDLEIDKINKPYLPLASGAFSLRTAKTIILFCGLAALIISCYDIYLLGVIIVSLLIGTLYSMPPARLKRFPFWAAMSILVVRGIVVNIGLFLYFLHQFEIPLIIPPPIWLLTIFFVSFGIAIAILKDVPDITGDKIFKIRTFALSIGAKNIFRIALTILTGCYLLVIISGFAKIEGVNQIGLIVTHLIILTILLLMSKKVEITKKDSIISFYMFIWKLFFLEYIIFPIFCVLA
jgi:homogentisate phytyltransferase/homogentisate geranylgeranyltransferase